MAPATTQEEGGDASRARWWRMQRGDRIRCAPSTTPEEAEEASRSPSVAESRVPRGGGLIRHAPNPTHEEGEEALRSQSPVDEPSSRQDKKKKRKSDGKKSKKRKRARDIEHAHFSEASSATSSPLRWPLDPPSQVFDPAIEDACVKLRSKFHKKSALHCKLITLARPSTRSCIRDEKFLHVRDSVTPVVMKAGKAVLRLSSYIDDKPLSQSSGFLIDWNKDSKPNTILTSALLIRSNSPSDEWSGTEEYIPDAVVLVHLLDKHETTIAAHLLHYDKHFNIALFKIDMDVSAEIPSFSTELVYGQEAFVLGRDDGLFLNIDHGRIQYQGPNMYECRHYVFMSCHLISQCGAGGPVIDFNGQVLGMAYPGTKFIPSSIILRCLQMWKKFSLVQLRP
ncbi:hypothetical protein QOZ80_5AG0405080 [Eleusine coracana subsp. coracana]|nr:hypothetical protein QOZ80_5AG0405080 [Eleusine coracana subsp. coracana]